MVCDGWAWVSYSLEGVFRLSRISRFFRSDHLKGYLFISPWLIGFFAFSVYPIAAALYYSFTEYNVLMPPEWIGTQNYKAIWTDGLFHSTLYNTVYYVALSVPLKLLVALLLAALLNQKVRGISVFRTLFYLPTIVPIVGSAILWMWILNPQYGLLNAALSRIGIQGPGWLTSPTWSKPALILMSCWSVGVPMLVFMAGLQDIPRQLYEAVEIDGGTSLHKFLHITIPLLTPTIFFNLVMGLIQGFQTFSESFIMTQGGPMNSTLFYLVYLFRNAFVYFEMGYASALAMILFLIILTLTMIVNWTSNRWVYYEGD
jgi:multiple sugar transport system permease protein